MYFNITFCIRFSKYSQQPNCVLSQSLKATTKKTIEQKMRQFKAPCVAFKSNRYSVWKRQQKTKSTEYRWG